ELSDLQEVGSVVRLLPDRSRRRWQSCCMVRAQTQILEAFSSACLLQSAVSVGVVGFASAERGEQLLCGWVWLVPPGEPGADVAGEPRGDVEVSYLRAAREGEAGHESDADAGADQGAHEAVVAGTAGDLETETAEGGEHVGDIADIAPAWDPASVRDLGQAGGRVAGQRVARGNQQPQRVGDKRDIGAGPGGG